MNSDYQELQHILSHYPVAEVLRIEAIPLSLINKNFFVETEDGNYILQRMANIFTHATVDDMAKVTMHLDEQSIPTLTLIPTHTQKWSHEDTEGFLWKLMVAVEGETFHVIPHPQIAYEAGRLLGGFQQGLKQFDPQQLNNPLRLHETENVHADFINVYPELIAQEKNTAYRDAYEYIYEHLPKVLLPSTLPWSVVHGDPKISNFIFKDGQGVCMIDLDTTMHHTPLVDVGDALRSWCGQTEDEPNNSFSLEIFEEAMKGYLSVMPLTRQELSYVYTATRMITLELAARFAKDIVQDYYFGWDESQFSSRKEHNAARAYSMVVLAQDMEKKHAQIEKIISRVSQLSTSVCDPYIIF